MKGTDDPQARGIQLAYNGIGQQQTLSDHGAADLISASVTVEPDDYVGPIFRGQDGYYFYRRDGSSGSFHPGETVTFIQDMLASRIGQGGSYRNSNQGVGDRRPAAIAYAYRQLSIYGNSPGVLKVAADNRAAIARGDAAVANAGMQFALLVPSLAALGAAPATIVAGASTMTSVLAVDAATGAGRGLLTGNYRSALAEGGNRLTGTGANGSLGVGDVAVIGANVVNFGRAMMQGVTARFSGAPARAAGPANGEASVGWNNGWRTADGKFASPIGSGRAGSSGETAVWDAIETKQGWSAIRGQVAVRDASGQLRYYDGAAITPRGRVIGLETKSGAATRTPAQRLFDSTLNANPFNVATGVGQGRGISVQRSILIRVP